MFTRDFEKLRLVALTLAAAASIYLGLAILLNRAAERAEAAGAHPYLAGEESMRLLLPSFVKGRRVDILLTGPSDAAEAFVVADFESAFPRARTASMAISAGTLDDMLLVLQYIEKVHGPRAAPRVLVAGISARAVANIPRRFGPSKDADPYAPLVATLNRYSPMAVESTPLGSQLAPKSAAGALLARLRFTRKQQPRHRAAVVSGAHRLVGHDPRAHSVHLPPMRDIRAPFTPEDLGGIVGYVKHAGATSFICQWLDAYTSPYLYRFMARLPEWEVRAMVSQRPIYTRVHAWVPERDRHIVRAQLQRLSERCAALGIRLYVVNLPEHRLHRERYARGEYEAYLRLVQESLGHVPFLELRELLNDAEFYDGSHPSAEGGRRITERVVARLKDARPEQ